MDIAKFITLLVQSGTFIAAFAGIAASFIMLSVTRKFGVGILAATFGSISWGVTLIAGALIVDAISFYLQIGTNDIIIFTKTMLLVLGTYTIVIGAKKTADKLENVS